MEEFELTYLVKILPVDIKVASHQDIIDIYIPASVEHPTFRIRKNGNKREITKKEPIHGQDSSHQLETTIPLSEDEFQELNNLAGKRIYKTRYFYNENGVNYEIDVFRGGLEGLVLVDVEFNSLAEKGNFVPPSWCLVEVTQEKFIAGGMLCGKRYDDIRDNLEGFGYKKLRISPQDD